MYVVIFGLFFSSGRLSKDSWPTHFHKILLKNCNRRLEKGLGGRFGFLQVLTLTRVRFQYSLLFVAISLEHQGPSLPGLMFVSTKYSMGFEGQVDNRKVNYRNRLLIRDSERCHGKENSNP